MPKELNWQKWLKQGDQYMLCAAPKDRKSKFVASIRYNLLSMALESYIMAILDYHYIIPSKHTYTDLLDSLTEVISMKEDLRQRLLKYENIQSICSLKNFHVKDPTEEDLLDLRNAIHQMGALAHETCSQPRAEQPQPQ